MCSRKMKRERSELFKVKGSSKNHEAEFTDTCPKGRNQKGDCEMFGKFLAVPGQIWQVIKRREKREGQKRGNTRRGKFFFPSLFIGVEGCVMVHSIHFRHVSAKEKSRSGDSFSLSVLASI